MSVSVRKLIRSFRDPEYREAYAGGFLASWIALQLATIRKQRGLTQQELAERVGTKQPGIARMERDDYGRWNLATLQRTAFALDCRLRVSFETFGSLIDEAANFTELALQRQGFSEDQAFSEAVPDGGQLEPIEEMRVKLQEWTNTGASLESLADWLQGFNLPPAGDEVSPRQWLLKASSGDAAIRAALVEASRSALEREHWDVDQKRSFRLRQNLFGLIEGLRCPDVLGEPLFACLQRREATSGDDLYPGHPLARAVMFNQPDDRFRNFWNDTFIRTPALGTAGEFVAFGFLGMAHIGGGPNVSALVRAVRSTQEWTFDESVAIGIVADALRGVWEAFADHATLPTDVLLFATKLRGGWSHVSIKAFRQSLPLEIVISDDAIPLLHAVLSVAC